MKYKVGDKVRVRKDLKVNCLYRGVNFVEDMEYLKGKIVTIKEKLHKSYKIVEDYGQFYWSDNMLEDYGE